MNELVIAGHKRSLPSTMEELTNEQLRKVAPFVFNLSMDLNEKKVRSLYVLIDIKMKVFKNIEADIVQKMADLMAFIFDDTSISRSFVPSVTINEVEYFGPKDGFENVSMIEYAMVDALFDNLDQEHLTIDKFDEIIATLYRPKGTGPQHDPTSPEFTGDVREKYNTFVINARKDFVSQIDPGIRMSIIRFYIGSRKLVQERYSVLFDRSVKKADPAPKQEIVPTWIAMIYEIAKSGIFGDFEKTCNTNMHTFCIHACREQIAFDKRQKEERIEALKAGSKGRKYGR